ncbi:MAG: WbqC family protein [Muribaculaceae bacterium]|nr:WbqC family protein [Muribaculaceae bacterium]
MNPLVLYPRDTLLLAPRLFGSIGYYAAMARYGRVVIDTAMRYDKRAKAVHRYDIVDTRGPVTLTVPLAKPHGSARPTWADAAVSTHDQWWHQHRITLESAYGRTPFFEFVYDRFAALIADPTAAPRWPSAIDLAREADRAVRALLGFENTVLWQPAADEAPAVDLRRADFTLPDMSPYWQVRAHTLGFSPNLSILDLIFNLGPEAAIYLNSLTLPKDYALPR